MSAPERKVHRVLVVDRTAGEAMVIGYLAADQSALVVAVRSQFTEMPEASCSPTGRTASHRWAPAIGANT